jgi:hypothetical protein
MNSTIDISRFIPEAETIIEELYKEEKEINIKSFEDFLKLPVSKDYIGDIKRFIKDVSDNELVLDISANILLSTDIEK